MLSDYLSWDNEPACLYKQINILNIDWKDNSHLTDSMVPSTIKKKKKFPGAQIIGRRGISQESLNSVTFNIGEKESSTVGES